MSVISEKSAFGMTGAIQSLAEEDIGQLVDRSGGDRGLVSVKTAELIARVKLRGDAELREMAIEFDGVSLGDLEVPPGATVAALDALDPTLRSALERAARNIAKAQSIGFPKRTEVETEPGVTVGRRPDPLDRIGVYAPGGRAAYASSVLMCAVPARAAGVREIIVCSPPGRDGMPSQVVLAACAIAGIDRVFAVGGAGAIAAMAYGTQSIPRVDKIVGPGNAFVAESKLQVMSVTGIDCPAGPSELFVIYDESADIAGVASEVIAQAEHDPDARVIVVALGEAAGPLLERALIERIDASPRNEIVRVALAKNGALLFAASTGEAIDLANRYAPEHLLLAMAGAIDLLPLVRNAGCVFVGETSSVVFGDYISGGNHVLPTGGLARSYSGLSVLDFVRWTNYQIVTPEAARGLARDTAILAAAEGLSGHAAAGLRFGEVS